MRHPKFLSKAGYEAVATYIRQATDPKRTTPPDPQLLLIEPTHGPITGVELATVEGELQVAVSIHGRNPRFLDPLDFCAVQLGTAFGMGLSCNDTGQGLTYPKFRVAEPKNRAIHLLRVLTDAQPWEVAEQRPAVGPRPDYHHLSRKGLSKRSVRSVWKEGKRSRVPRVARQEFYAAVEWYWRRNHLAADIGVTLSDHLNLIRAALEAGDGLTYA
jgi:hypothetical protein